MNDDMDLFNMLMSNRYIFATEQPRCNICGRYARAARNSKRKIMRNPDGKVAGWWFPCVIYDSYMGAWEHE